MPRAPKKCAKPECQRRVVGVSYCPDHQRVGWESGPNRTNTAEHKAWRKAVLARDKGVCQLRYSGCTYRATEADHIFNVKRGGALYDLANGQAACSSCHRVKTQREAKEGRRLAAG